MEHTISELYEKYTGQVGEALEDDRYFQYLFEMIQAGDNTLQQKYRILHKVIDEQWLTVVEDGIQSIFNIVDKPRRFIATSEEVVPVALAKKITADSVKHLSQNTQFIASTEDDDIQPTHVLNVTTEESFDLYENRFVYHLIQRLFAFVDKRTDVIFWSTGDETCNVMSMESKVDDAYEEISYKVEMTIKNRQSLVENDTDNMDLFKRIDRVRRMSRILRASSFCDIMNGCAKVRSPIQRTNLMMKDPDYRTCYKLWQFIESYDEVGYTIEEQDSALQFDEEYLIQMYINMITNYTVFKSLLESDSRHVTELATEKREPVKPKFVKKIEEQIVEDRNIPDVEIRKVFVEEVTQAQIEAEEKLSQETQKREELENYVSELEWQVDSTTQQLEAVEDMNAQLEEEKTQTREQLEKETEARKQAEAAVEQADLEARKSIELAQKEAKELVETAQREKEEAVSKAQSEAKVAVEQAKQKAEREIKNAQQESKAAIEKAEKEAKDAVEQAEQKAEREIQNAQKKSTDEIKKVQNESKEAIEKAQKESVEKIGKVQQESHQEITRIKNDANQEIEKEKRDASEKLQAAQEAIEQLKRKLAESESERKKAQEAAKHADKELEAVKRERDKAVAKAEGSSLSKYILKTIKKRQEQKKDKEDHGKS